MRIFLYFVLDMKKIIHRLFILIVLTACLFFSKTAWAYIDPGTGGVVFSTLGYLLAAGAAAFGFLISPIKKWIQRLRERRKTEKND